MIASNLLSRFLPPTGSPSVYEAIRQNDAESDASDVEERAGMALDEENLRQRFDHDGLEEALANATDSQMTTHSTAFLGQDRSRATSGDRLGTAKATRRKMSRPRWMQTSARELDVDEGDDDVPASLLVEGGEDDFSKPPGPPPPHIMMDPGSPVPGPSSRDDRNKWESTKVQQPLHPSSRRTPPTNRSSPGQYPSLALVDPKQKALWRWANVENLDNFLEDVYIYFLGNGIWCIMLSRALNLLTLGFVVGFTTFLTSCINYQDIRGAKKLDDILVKKCMVNMSTSRTLLLWLFTFFWIGKLFQYVLDIRRLRHLQDFYYYLLGISDDDIQTISWQEIVSRLMALRDSNPSTAGAVSARHRKFMGSQSKQRMDAHDIANRLMRKENYLIALFNKDILDLTLPIPFLRNRQLFSRTLEWNINLCIMDYVFNEQGQVRPLFLKDTHRRALSDGLRRRFLFAGIMNIFVSPFLVFYFLMHYFFRYFNEYQKNPSQIGSRQYTPLAEWKFREFNELWHLFQRRINMSYPFANRYIDQFPKEKTVQFARFVAFVTGALTSVLALASVVDPELFLGFEITHDRTVLFYLGLFGSIWAVARGLVPEETDVFDPEFALREVINFTHYFPNHWNGRLHSDDIRKEFATLYQMKIVIFLEEILSMIFTPFVLWFSLPKCSDRLIDFFREFTVHVDGLGYVCSFAVFDFKKGTNAISQGQAPRREGTQDLRDDYFSTKDGKMLASYYGFLDNYGANPRMAAPYGPSNARRRFHPPPSFPTLASPPGTEATPRPDRWDPLPTRQSPVNGPLGYQSMMRGSRFGGGAGAAGPNSPLPSMLLDPHHQPSASGFRSINRTTAHSRYRSRPSHPTTDPIDSEDEPSTEGLGNPATTQAAQPAVASSGGVGTSESNLEGSWRTHLAAEPEDSDGAEERDNVDAIVGGAGVLGLIHQFQKVSNEGRGGGTVGI